MPVETGHLFFAAVFAALAGISYTQASPGIAIAMALLAIIFGLQSAAYVIAKGKE